jgi:hypothetical protein
MFTELAGLVPPAGLFSDLREQNYQGREARRSAGAASDRIRIDHQSESRRGTWRESAAVAACPCRGTDRIAGMPLLALSGHQLLHRTRPLSEVNRTRRFVEVRFCVRYLG